MFNSVLRYGLLSQGVLDTSFPTNGLVSYWRFDESVGTIAYDALGNNNGIASNARVLGNVGFENNCSDFTQGSDNLNLGLNSFGSELEEASVSFWAYLPSSIIDRMVFFSNNSSNNMQWEFFLFSSDQLYYYVKDSNGDGLFAQQIDLSYTSGWHHFVVNHKASTNTIDMYYDGINLNVTPTITETPSSFIDFTNNVVMGVRNISGTYDYYVSSPIVDELAIWNRKLSTVEVNNIYNSGAGKFYPIPENTLPVTNDLAIWYGDLIANVDRNVLADATQITQWDDLSGNDNNATMNSIIYDNTENALEFQSTVNESNYGLFNGVNVVSSVGSSIFVVYKKEAGNTYANLLGRSDVNVQYRTNSANNYIEFVGAGTTGAFVSGVNLGILGLASHHYDGSTAYVKWNGNSGSSVSVSPTNQVLNSIGGRSNGTLITDVFKGFMYEIIIYNRTLSTSEITQVETYLNNKYTIY